MAPCEPSIELRLATLADVEPMYPIHREAMREYVAATWGPWDEAYQQVRFGENFTVGQRQIIVVDGVDVGFMDVAYRPDHVWLAEIEIGPAYQRRGIGGRLVSDLLTAAAARRLPVRLQVLKVNPARRLYERLGFVETGQSESHFLMQAGGGY